MEPNRARTTLLSTNQGRLGLIATVCVHLVACSHPSPPPAQVEANPSSAQAQPGAAPALEQKIEPLDDEMTARLNQQRQVVADALKKVASNSVMTGRISDLQLLQKILDARLWNEPNTYELQSIGIVLGDVFAAELGMEWVVVEDSFGRDPAVRYPGSSVMLFPLTMVSKRVERGETIDIEAFYNAVAKQVVALKEASDPNP